MHCIKFSVEATRWRQTLTLLVKGFSPYLCGPCTVHLQSYEEDCGTKEEHIEFQFSEFYSISSKSPRGR